MTDAARQRYPEGRAPQSRASLAGNALTKVCSCIRERWEHETTPRNLGLIREARERHGAAPAWATAIEKDLVKRASA